MLQVHFCERRMANTEAESVDDMVDASKGGYQRQVDVGPAHAGQPPDK